MKWQYIEEKTVEEKAGHIHLLGNARNFMTEAVVTQFYFFFGGVYLNLMLMYGIFLDTTRITSVESL